MKSGGNNYLQWIVMLKKKEAEDKNKQTKQNKTNQMEKNSHYFVKCLF